LLEARISENMRELLFVAYKVCEGENADGEGHQQPEYNAEDIEKVGIVFAHVGVRSGGSSGAEV
jgi:hypothetical protein